MKNAMQNSLGEKARNISKKTMAIALAAAIVLSGAAGAGVWSLVTSPAKASVEAARQMNAEGEENVEKDETVYVIADANGNPQKVIVSDWLKNEQKNAGIASIGDDGYTIDSDSSYAWDAESGELDGQPELPVGVKLTYMLDGKEMSAEEIAGKSGKATIRFDYTNNRKQTVAIDGRETDVYVPFTVVTGAVLDDSVFSHIEVSNGKVINDGTRSIVIGFALPGMQESLALKKDSIELPDSIEITADVRNFSLTTTLTMVTNDLFNEAAEDIEEKKAEKGDGDVSLDKLTGGINALADGSSALYDGTTQLLDKSALLISGIHQLAAGGEQVSGGVNTVRQTLQLLCSKNADLQGGAASVFDTLLSTTRKQVQAAGMDCPELTRENYAQVLGAISSGLSEESLRALAEQARPGITAQVESAVRENVAAQVEANSDAISQQVTAAVEQQVRGQVLEGVLDSMGMTEEQYQAADEATRAAIDGNVNAMTQQQMQSGQVQSAIQSAVEGQKQQLIESNMQSAEVQAQIRAIVDSEINKALAEKLPAAKEGQKSIEAAIEQLNAYNEFYVGICQYTNGVQALYNGTAELQSGAKQLSDGLDQLNGGTDALTEGITKLNDGAMQLSDGMKQFKEGSLGKLAELTGGSVSGLSARFRALRDISEAYRSYTGLPDGESGKVKFIYRTDSVEAPDAK